MAEAQAAQAVRAAGTSLQNSFTRQTTGEEGLGKEDFLKLMMAQMTNQDPLDPLDSKGMMDQVTSMGSLEQLMNINRNLEAAQQVQGDIARANAFAFLDKDVTVPGGKVTLRDGQAPGMQFSLPRRAASVQVNIRDMADNPVRTLELGAQDEGRHQVTWDARGEDGRPVPEGRYRYSVTARTEQAEQVPAELFMRGKVSSVRFKDGRPLLQVNGEEVDIREVVQMSQRSRQLFGERAPLPLRQELRPRPPVLERSP